MKYGVTKNGFLKKPFNKTLEEIEEKVRSRLGNDVYQTPESEIGQLNSVFCDMTSDLWDVFEGLYNARFPSTSFGKSLDNAMEFTLNKRLSGTPCHITRAVVKSDNPGTVRRGDVCLLGPDKHKFIVNHTVSMTPESGGYTCEISLLSAENNHFLISAGSVLTAEESEFTARVLEFKNGTARENDSQAKIRMRKNQASGAHSTFPALRQRLEKMVPGVSSVDFIRNESKTNGPDGQPPDTVQILLEGGDTSDIARVLHNDCIPVGTPLWGKIRETVSVPETGETFIYRFSQIETVPVYVLAEISVGDEFQTPDISSDLTAYFKSLLAVKGNSLKRGQDVHSDPWLASAFAEIIGIEDLEIGLRKGSFPDNTLTQNLTINPWEKAGLNPDNIKVVMLTNQPLSDTAPVRIRGRLTFSANSEGKIDPEDIKSLIARQTTYYKRGALVSSALISRAISHPDFISVQAFSVDISDSGWSDHARLLDHQKPSAGPSDIDIELEFV